MNVAEGARRMRRAGQGIVLIKLAALVLLSTLPVSGNVPIPGIAEVAVLALLGAAVWPAAWIIDGCENTTA
jgi:hypothetical protein